MCVFLKVEDGNCVTSVLLFFTEKLKDHFSTFGEVIEATIKLDPDNNNRSRSVL